MVEKLKKKLVNNSQRNFPETVRCHIQPAIFGRQTDRREILTEAMESDFLGMKLCGRKKWTLCRWQWLRKVSLSLLFRFLFFFIFLCYEGDAYLEQVDSRYQKIWSKEIKHFSTATVALFTPFIFGVHNSLFVVNFVFNNFSANWKVWRNDSEGKN